MKLTITTLPGDLYTLDVGEDMEVENLKALCEFESKIPAREMVVTHDGRPLIDDKKTLHSYDIKTGDILLIQHLIPEPSSEASRTVLDDLDARDRMRMSIMDSDPFDPESQMLIAEEIRKQNIDSNMEAAIEHNPESFAQVIMLYINCRVNGHPVKAFIDSGAQTTIMSQNCANRCNVMRLVDTRWAGLAKGVGTQRIIGRIHLVQIEIEGVFFTSAFSVLEKQPMDMLLGLDMLKRHQCCIDLKRNVLVIGSTDTETKFLSENELPECARLDYINSQSFESTTALTDSRSRLR